MKPLQNRRSIVPVSSIVASLITLFAASADASNTCYKEPFSNPNLKDGWHSTLPPRTSPHAGLDYPQKAGTKIPSVANGTVIKTVKSSCLGNVIIIKHPDGMYSGYSHLQVPSTLKKGEKVKLGQTIGKVGETGTCAYGAHLHLTLSKYEDGYGNYTQTVDPHKYIKDHATCTPDYKASLVSQSFGTSNEPWVMLPGEERKGFFEFKNEGGKTWKVGEVRLGTSNPRDAQSALEAEDWIGGNRPATIDADTAKGGVARVEFSLKAPEMAGTYTQNFNLVREKVTWFDDDGGPKADAVGVTLVVKEAVCPSGLAAVFTCDGDGRTKCDPQTGAVTHEACAEGCVVAESGAVCDVSSGTAGGSAGSSSGSNEGGAGGSDVAGVGGSQATGASGAATAGASGQTSAGAAGTVGAAGRTGTGTELGAPAYDDVSENEGGCALVGSGGATSDLQRHFAGLWALAALGVAALRRRRPTHDTRG
jgi:MYXO-CTERM domain-containing protein